MVVLHSHADDLRLMPGISEQPGRNTMAKMILVSHKERQQWGKCVAIGATASHLDLEV